MKLLIFFLLMTVPSAGLTQTFTDLKRSIDAEFRKVEGVFGLAFFNLRTGEMLLINEREMFHAASTMKTPVMIEIFKWVKEGRLSLGDSIEVKNEFRSIVDGSSYQLDLSDDSDDSMYRRIGGKATIRELMYQMITVSSNLATNILIDLVDAKNVSATMRSMGAVNIRVLRGVEDGQAFRKGLNNTTDAYDQMLILRAIAEGRAVDSASSKAMIDILFEQKFNDLIPALLPKNVRVAHKTGSITGVEHDCGVVFLADGRRYVLVILSKELKDVKGGKDVIARVSKMIYDIVERSH